MQCKKCKSGDKTDSSDAGKATIKNKKKVEPDISTVREPPVDPEDNHRVSRGKRRLFHKLVLFLNFVSVKFILNISLFLANYMSKLSS